MAYIIWGDIWGDIWGPIWVEEGEPPPIGPPLIIVSVDGELVRTLELEGTLMRTVSVEGELIRLVKHEVQVDG